MSEDIKPKISEIIQIRVLDQEDQEVLFKIKKSTALKKMMDAYCERKGIDRRAIRFAFNGDRINDSSTPKELGIEDGDTIDIQLEQIGGYF